MAPRTERKLAAILAADVVGYSRLVGDDEAGTIARLRTLRKDLVEPLIAEYHGRVVKLMGDGALVEFASVVDAVECAAVLQAGVAARQAELPEHQRIAFRIGINLGDVIIEGDDIHGDGVNVAARLEALAEPGGICISRSVRTQIQDKLPLIFEDLGEKALKNVRRPVQVFRVLAGNGRSVAAGVGRTPRRGPWRGAAAVVAIIVLVVAGSLVWWLEPWASRERRESAPISASALAPAGDPVLAVPSGPAIAVLPFDNLSGDPEQGFFADGLTEDIITRLARFNDLRVIARNSTFRYKDQPADVRQIGHDLGARYVVEGSVRRSAEALRVTAQLIDTRGGEHLWAETYDRDLSVAAVFEVQDDITDRVVAAIASSQGAITLGHIREIRTKAPAHLASYDCVLLAHIYERLNDRPSHLAALTCLDRVVRTDPDYAEAWAWLAYLYTEQIWSNYNVQPGQDPAELAARAAERAVELDPANARGHAMLAFVHYYRRQRDAFLTEAQRALALNPNDASVLAEMSLRFGQGLGMWEEALAMSDKAIALSPHPPPWYHGARVNYYYQKGEYEKALAANDEFATSGLYWSYLHYAAIYAQLGGNREAREAREAITKVLELEPDYPKRARADIEYWNWGGPGHVEHWLDGLRKAGLAIQ
jgi:adenylate cyclase